MAKVANSSSHSGNGRPALSLEGREGQLCALAVDLAEKQLRDGTASSQIITHYLKLASVEKQLEMEILREQKKLITAKTEDIESRKEIKALYEDALKAMRTYSGQGDNDEDTNIF